MTVPRESVPGGATGTGREAAWLFYDGGCGLCHGTVRWALVRDHKQAFVFAPLGGESFQSRVPKEHQPNLPDSIVLLTRGGELLVKSRAVRTMLQEIGGPWRIVAAAMGLVPPPISDWVYDRIAAIRHRLFKKPDDICPIVPPELRSRFRN